MNRRKFLGLIGGTLGACALTCGGSAILLSGEKPPESVLPLAFPDTLSRGNEGGKRILVVYASESGSTGGIAGLIGAPWRKIMWRWTSARFRLSPTWIHIGR